MPAQQDPVMGLYHGYSSSESGWGDQVSSNFTKLGALAQLAVISRSLTSAPGTPVNGARYIVAAGATGIWAGKSGQIAIWRAATSAWEFYVPFDGMLCVVTGEGTWGTLTVYKGGSWSPGTALG